MSEASLHQELDSGPRPTFEAPAVVGALPIVGHAIPFDLEFNVLPACVFDEPAVEPPIYLEVWRISRRLPIDRTLLSETDPRGPPA